MCFGMWLASRSPRTCSPEMERLYREGDGFIFETPVFWMKPEHRSGPRRQHRSIRRNAPLPSYAPACQSALLRPYRILVLQVWHEAAMVQQGSSVQLMGFVNGREPKAVDFLRLATDRWVIRAWLTGCAFLAKQMTKGLLHVP
jgi:hypothetical protein